MAIITCWVTRSFSVFLNQNPSRRRNKVILVTLMLALMTFAPQEGYFEDIPLESIILAAIVITVFSVWSIVRTLRQRRPLDPNSCDPKPRARNPLSISTAPSAPLKTQPDLMPRRSLKMFFVSKELVVIQLPDSFALAPNAHFVTQLADVSIQSLTNMVGSMIGAKLLQAIVQEKIIGLTQIGYDRTRFYLLCDHFENPGEVASQTVNAVKAVLWPSKQGFVLPTYTYVITEEVIEHFGSIATLLEFGLSVDVIQKVDVILSLPQVKRA